MGIKEAACLIALVVFVVYAYTRRPKPGDPGWHPLGYADAPPVTLWGLIGMLAGTALLIWLLHVGHLLVFGSN